MRLYITSFLVHNCDYFIFRLYLPNAPVECDPLDTWFEKTKWWCYYSWWKV